MPEVPQKCSLAVESVEFRSAGHLIYRAAQVSCALS